MEIWKDILGYEGKYQISNIGRCRSYAHFGNSAQKRYNTGLIKRLKEPKILKNCLNSNGYYEVSLVNNDGIVKNKYIHTLVAETFIGEVLGKVVCHLNDVKTDNRMENLFIGTHQNNKDHAIFNNKTVVGSKHKNSKIKEKDVIDIFIKYSYGIKKASIARIYGLSKTQVGRILEKKSWRHVNG